MKNIDFFSNRDLEYNMCNKCIDFSIDKFKKYKLFSDLVIKDKFIVKPNSFSSYATQGVCSVGDTILITSYDTKCDIDSIRNNSKNSILDIVDEFGRYKTLYFDNKYHVGGISYCENTNKLYITGKSCVNIYDINYIAELDDGLVIKKYNSFGLNVSKDGISVSSYLSIYKDKLYVGEFKKIGVSYLIQYKLNNDDVYKEKVYKVPYSKIQGMCVCNYNNEDYYLFSSSYGRKFNSKLYITRLVNDKFVELLKVTLPSMLEQISFDKNGDLMMVFESDCYKYCGVDGKGKVLNSFNNVCFLDTKNLFEYIFNVKS